MAIDNQFGKGIGVAAGFDLGAKKPLDARIAVNTIAERDAHVENNRAYEGMLVYVDETKKNYQLIDGEWVELLKAEQDRLDALEAMLNGEGEEGQAGGALGSLQDSIDDVNDRLEEGGDIENRISQNESDIVGLQELVGHPIQAGEGEEGDTPATGLHLALDNAKAELEQAILDEKDRAEGQEAAIRQELADEATEIRGEMAAELGNYTVEASEGVEGKEASGLRKEIEDAHKAIEGAMATETQRVDNKIADDIATESALRVAEEAKIEGKADANTAAIAKLNGGADEEGSVAKAVANAVKAEEDRAKEVEEDHEDRIAANEAFVAAQPAVDAAQDKRLEILEGLVVGGEGEGIEAVIGDVAKNTEAIAKLNGDANTAGSVDNKVATALATAQGEVQAEATARENADNALSKRIAVFEAGGTQDVAAKEIRLTAAEEAIEGLREDVDRLDGDENTEGSVKKQIKDAIDAVNGAAETLEARVKANEDAIGKAAVEADENGEGAQAATGLHKLIADEDARVLAEAKEHAEQKITELVDSAPETMNTLKELAKAINDNKDVYDAYVEEHAQAMTQQKADLQAEIDADVKVVADELAKQKDAEQEGTLANQIKVEKGRAEGQETAIRQELANEKAALQKEIDDDVKAVVDAQKLINDAQAETNEEFEGRIAANEAFVTAQPAIDQAQDNKIKALEDAIGEGGTTKKAIEAAQAAAEAAQADVDAVEKRLDDEGGLIDRLEVAEAFVETHDHSVMEQGIAANKAAIEAEVGKEGVQGNRDKAIAAALEAYSTTEEVKTILGNVVATLNLSMADDKVVLKLGGAEGIEITSVSLDLATDDDIDAIIAGLDAPAEE